MEAGLLSSDRDLPPASCQTIHATWATGSALEA